jgi:two-component system, response regulator YesN
MIQILLVDDEAFSLRGMQKMVPWEQWNCTIAAVADSAVKALEIIDSTDIDIVFTDIKMPEMDGLQLIHEVRKKNSKIKFVIVSGYGEFDYAQKAIRYGVRNYLLKPVGVAEFEEVLLQLNEELSSSNKDQSMAAGETVSVSIEKYVDQVLTVVASKEWNRISQILLNLFKEINAQGGKLEQSREYAIRLLSSLIKTEIIFSNEATLLLAGKIGSSGSQGDIYTILKEQILLTQNQSVETIGNKMNSHIQKILIHLIKHYRDKNLTLKWFSEHVVFVKADYLGKLFQQETGKSFASYLAEFRVARACEHLKNSAVIPIYDLAELVGYDENVSYFIRQFKKIKGMTPAEFASKSVVNE